MTTVQEHIEHLTIRVDMVDPDHGNRSEAPETDFERSKRRLKEDGHYKCFLCGTTENLQVHHYLCEWSEANTSSLQKVKTLAEKWDCYGYGKLLSHKPIENQDDIRNMMVLCQAHHTGSNHQTGTGIGVHYLTMPAFIAQVVAKDGANPVPQRGETEEQALARVEQNETHE